MTSQSILIRCNDKKVFKVTFLSHWSSIGSEDGETDTIKCLGGYEYISLHKGFTYILQEE